jgi:hypothetical protein
MTARARREMDSVDVKTLTPAMVEKIFTGDAFPSPSVLGRLG